MSWQRQLLRSMILAVLTILVGLGILAGCMIAQQEKLIYMPRAYTPAEIHNSESAGLKRLTFTNAEGAQSAFWKAPLSPAKEPALPFTWLVFSGNGGCALDYFAVAQEGPTACGWLFVDYPGYGACQGNPSPASMRANARGAVEALATELGCEVEALIPRLGTFGHSIGAAVALDFAAEVGIQRAVVVAPFTSMRDMAARHISPLLTGFLRHRFDNRAALQGLADQGARVAIFHGSADKLIPHAMGLALADRFPGITSFTSIPNAGHNDAVDRGMQSITEALAP